MDIVVAGRHTDISDRFRALAEEKLDKISQLSPTAHRVDVLVVRERNPRLADTAERVEITVTGRGPVVRAEAAATDRNTALDLALAKVQERLRRARDRRKGHRTAGLPHDVDLEIDVETFVEEPEELAEALPRPERVGEVVESTLGDSPVVIREKLHQAEPMTLDDALYEMELVGHDFFLFVDTDTRQPAVVYRRRGWSYGVIRLDTVVGAVVG